MQVNLKSYRADKEIEVEGGSMVLMGGCNVLTARIRGRN